MTEPTSLWMRADALVRETERVADASHLVEMVRELAGVVRDHIEATGLAAETVAPLEEGKEYLLLLRVKAICTEATNDDNGRSYELQLESRDFFGGRVFAVDHNEIVGSRLAR